MNKTKKSAKELREEIEELIYKINDKKALKRILVLLEMLQPHCR